jgi:hypothetical protein
VFQPSSIDQEDVATLDFYANRFGHDCWLVSGSKSVRYGTRWLFVIPRTFVKTRAHKNQNGVVRPRLHLIDQSGMLALGQGLAGRPMITSLRAHLQGSFELVLVNA